MSNDSPTSLPPDATPEHQSVWRTVRSFPRPVWLLLLGTFISKFGTFVVPFLALRLTEMGYTSAEAGLCVGAYGGGHIVASIIGGHLADTIGRRNTIALSMFSAAASLLVLSQATSFWGVFGLAMLAGLTGEFYRPASSALLADLVPERDRVLAYAAYRFAINAGWAFGPAVAGVLAKHSFLWLFVGNAITCVLFGLIALTRLPAAETASNAGWGFLGEAFRSVTEASRVAVSDTAFLRLVAASFATGLVFVQMISTLGPAMESVGLGTSQYGLVLALNGVLVVLLELPLSGYTRRLPPRLAITVGFALIGLGSMLYAWADSVMSFFLGMGVFTLGEIFSMPVAMAYAARLAPEAMRGRYLGLYGLTWAVALAFGPPLGMTLFGWNPQSLWLSCGVLGLLAAWIMLRSRVSAASARETPGDYDLAAASPPPLDR